MFAMSYPYDPNQHELLTKGELGCWLNKHFPGQNLTLYRHRRESTFVIAQRLANGQMVDVMNLGQSLGSFDRTRAANLIFLFSPTNTPDHLKRQIRREHDQCQDYHIGKEGYARGMVERAYHKRKPSILV